MTRISQQQLESYLWGAATLLRGTIDAGDYKQFIFPLLFHKRICDVFDEETAIALKESGGDNTFAAYRENHRFQVPPEAHWFEVRQTSNNVGQALQSAMRAIETANPEKLYGIFGDAQWTNKDRLSDAMLRDLVEHFSSLELTLANLPEDELGQGYEYLIKKFADDAGHTAAEFYTNRTVVHLMTEMLEPQPGESIYDPTCGSGGMLLSCITHLRRQGKEWRNVHLYGQERNLMTSSIARMNCFLHGIEEFQIVRGDTLSDPKFVQGDLLMRFGVVLANPPYSIKQWDRNAFASDPWGRNRYGTPPQGRADYAFWQHILCSLSPKTGRCAILFPHGVLFRQEESEMRRKLIEADVIECVLGLGPNLFYNSPMEACVIICRAVKPKVRKGRILFINAVNEVTRERAQSFLTDEHINRIKCAYRKFKSEPGFTRIATLEEIRAKDFSLSIPLYVESSTASSTLEVKETVLLAETLDAWVKSRSEVAEALTQVLPKSMAREQEARLRGSDTCELLKSKAKWPRVHFGDVVENLNETESNPAEAGLERFIGLEHLEPGSLHIRAWGNVQDGTTFTRRCRPGQVLFGKRRAYQRKVAVAEFDAVVSGDIYVLAPKDDRLLQHLLPFLCLSEPFFQHAIGTSAGSLSPRTNWASLASFEFDLPPLDHQRRIAEILCALDATSMRTSMTLNNVDLLMRRYLDSQFKFRGPGGQKVPFGRVHGGWRLGKMENEGDVQLGQQKHPKYEAGPNIRPYLRVDNVRDGWIDTTDVLQMHFPKHELNKFELRAGDILLNEGQTREYLGRSAIYRGEISGCCFQKTLIRFRCNPSLLPEFAQAFFRFLLYSGYFASHASQTAIAHITAYWFKKMPIPVPSIDEQGEIVRELQRIEKCMSRTEGHISASRSLLRELLSALI